MNTEPAQQDAANAGWDLVRRAWRQSGRSIRWQADGRRRGCRDRWPQIAGKLRKVRQGFPVRHALGLHGGLGVGAVLGNPAPQLLGGDRAVMLAVFSNDSIHRLGFGWLL